MINSPFFFLSNSIIPKRMGFTEVWMEDVMRSEKMDLVPKISALAKPISILKIDVFRDGGTIGIHLLGNDGGQFLCAVDNANRSTTQKRLYTGDFYPSTGSKFLQKGSQEEFEILQILQEIIDRDFSRDEQSQLNGSYGKRKLSEKERKVALCLAAINHVRSD